MSALDHLLDDLVAHRLADLHHDLDVALLVLLDVHHVGKGGGLMMMMVLAAACSSLLLGMVLPPEDDFLASLFTFKLSKFFKLPANNLYRALVVVFLPLPLPSLWAAPVSHQVCARAGLAPVVRRDRTVQSAGNGGGCGCGRRRRRGRLPSLAPPPSLAAGGAGSRACAVR